MLTRREAAYPTCLHVQVKSLVNKDLLREKREHKQVVIMCTCTCFYTTII